MGLSMTSGLFGLGGNRRGTPNRDAAPRSVPEAEATFLAAGYRASRGGRRPPFGVVTGR